MTHKDIYTKFMIEYDKANVTSSYPSLTQYEVATLLDKAYLALIARKFTGNNPRQQAFETDIKNMSDLQPLVVNSSPSLGIEGRPAPNVMSFGLPNDYLYYVQTALRLTMTGNPLDGVTNRAVPVKLVPHELATKFFSTPYNMPWVKNPVCYQENGKVFVVYDPVKSPDTKIADFVYIKYPKPFVLGIPDAPTYEDDGDIMDIPEDTNQGGHETPGQSGGNTTPTNPSLGGSQTPENPNQGGSGLQENPSQGGDTQPSTQWDSSYRIEKTRVGSTPYWCTLYVKVYHNDEQLIPDKNDFVHIIETDGVLQSPTVNITVFTEGEVRIAIRKIEGLSSQATSTITLIYANKVQKEFVVNLALTDVEINPDPTPVNPDPTPISANAYLVVNETYSSALENEITLKFNGEAATYFANKKGGAIFYVATSKNSSTWKELYRMWFGTSDGGRSFKILKEVDDTVTSSTYPTHRTDYWIMAEVYENEEFRQLLYTTEPIHVYNDNKSALEVYDYDGVRITQQLLKVDGSWVHRLTASVTDSKLRENISRYYLEIQKGVLEGVWSANPILTTVLSSSDNYTVTKDVPYEISLRYARARLWTYNPPNELAFNYYSKPVFIDHS